MSDRQPSAHEAANCPDNDCVLRLAHTFSRTCTQASGALLSRTMDTRLERHLNLLLLPTSSTITVETRHYTT